MVWHLVGLVAAAVLPTAGRLGSSVVCPPVPTALSLHTKYSLVGYYLLVVSPAGG